MQPGTGQTSQHRLQPTHSSLGSARRIAPPPARDWRRPIYRRASPWAAVGPARADRRKIRTLGLSVERTAALTRRGGAAQGMRRGAREGSERGRRFRLCARSGCEDSLAADVGDEPCPSGKLPRKRARYLVFAPTPVGIEPVPRHYSAFGKSGCRFCLGKHEKTKKSRVFPVQS